MKTFFAYASLALFSFVVNFFIYNYSFNVQATPYLLEEQRVDSGILMLKYTMPAFLISAVVLTVAYYFISKKMKAGGGKHEDRN